jgi:hypothetical protein
MVRTWITQVWEVVVHHHYSYGLSGQGYWKTANGPLIDQLQGVAWILGRENTEERKNGPAESERAPRCK